MKHTGMISVGLISVLVWSLLLLAGSAQAAMRCDRSWVDVGAPVYEVLSKCGEPAFQQLVYEPVIGVSNAHIHSSQSLGGAQSADVETDLWSTEPQYQVIERWIYDPGPGRLIQELDLYNGEVIRMRTGSRSP